ncbi:hypothetical protein B0F90DRAFT_1676727 [Multifurca ochricompacta]|uniref:Hyaluronan/mRNA-binding protein domain-containing protein n=1 Tax=Multifurca ochricompacta TaxID=376703 RepID=A0AAD4MCS8_9AGAM|nr:hypothetical protein B0F90DRAFT_1676727 [Multifurca ochricompacta]
MSVASANPFAILGEDTSPPGSPAPAPKNKDALAPQPARTGAKSKGPASRGGRYYSRGGKTQRDPTQDNHEEAPVGDESTKKRVDGEGRGRGRGRGRGDRGRGRGRPFDRHSGTGKIDSDKKIHQAWGGDEGSAELKAEEAGTTDAQAEGAAAAANESWGAAPSENWVASPPADEWGATPAEGDGAPATEGEKGDSRKPRERELEEEDNTISYDQYLAQLKENSASSIPKLEGVREANEGADSAWDDVIQPKKIDEEDAYYVGKTKAATKVRAEKKEKVYIEIDARFDRPSRGGRGRGGSDRGGGDRSGGDRGRGRSRGGTRGLRTNGALAPVSVDDETAFPSLS